MRTFRRTFIMLGVWVVALLLTNEFRPGNAAMFAACLVSAALIGDVLRVMRDPRTGSGR